jgi:cyanophycin synthetase
MGPSTKAIADAAAERGIPVRKMGNDNRLQLGVGRNSRVIEASLSDGPSCINVDMAGDKHLTKQILSGRGIPVPTGEAVYTLGTALLFAQQVGYPIVIKPCDANQGKGVTVNIKDETAAVEAFYLASEYSNAVIVERYIKGKDYRLLVVGGRVIAASERKPPYVTGDGEHTI